jgi:hypothetical protein
MTRTFRAFDAERTRTRGPVNVEFTVDHDGLPDVYLIYENRFVARDPRIDHERNWAIVRFTTVYFFRVYDDEFSLEPDAPEERVGPPQPLMVAGDSHLKDKFIAGNIHQPGVGLWPLGRSDRSADSLHHFRLVLDHDGIFDILALGADVTEEVVPCLAHDASQMCTLPRRRIESTRA